MDTKKKIYLLIKDVLKKEFLISDIDFIVEHPKDPSHGDYSTNIALAMFANSKLKTQNSKLGSPIELAQKITEKLEVTRPPASSLAGEVGLGDQKLEVIGKIEVVKPGFINFWLSKEFLLEKLKEIGNFKEEFKVKPEDLNKKVIVEYSSPNIAKPFTIGHLRSTIIGDAIANLLEANGWKVYRDNHLGDWGTQFGKLIYAIKNWGDGREIEKAKNPVKILVNLYVRFHREAEKNPSLEDEARKWFKKLEDKDKEARRLWQKCVEWSLREFQKIYERLGIKFTENGGLGYSESFFVDYSEQVIKELEEKRLLKESEGAKLVYFEKDPSAGSGQDNYPPLMILKQDGATLYATRDLATDKFRLDKYGKDIVVINEVGAEQSLYFRQLFEVEKMLGWYKEGQRIHIKHGLYRFKDEKMSTRRGNIIWLEDVLEEAEKRAKALSKDGKTKEDNAGKIGIGAIKWNDLKRSSHLDVVFDWNEVLNMEGNSGPYLQYAFVRTQSVLCKAKKANFQFPRLAAKRAISNFKLEAEELLLLRAVYRFPEVVEEAGEKFAPNLLCNYLFELAQEFNLFYQKHKILGSNKEEFRLALTQGIGKIIKIGLNLLGIEAPEKM